MRIPVATTRTRLAVLVPIALAVTLAVAGCEVALPGTITGGATPFSVATTQAFATAGPPTATPQLTRPELEVGVVEPRWSATSYGPSDITFHNDLKQIQSATAARWTALTFSLYQQSATDLAIASGPGTLPPDNLRQGIAYARSLGLKVYVEPLLRVYGLPSEWGGFLKFSDEATLSRWFDVYWSALEPYFNAAQQAGAEQMSLGTELQYIEAGDPALWEAFIAKAHAVYHGQIIYGMNWNSPSITDPPSWMSSPDLFGMGISAWWPIKVPGGSPTLTTMEDYWQQHILPIVDTFASTIGKPVLFSELGYRNTSDTLKDPYNITSSAPPDPQLQADAYTAACNAVFGDRHLVGIFIWAWNNDMLAPAPQGQAALHEAFLSPPA